MNLKRVFLRLTLPALFFLLLPLSVSFGETVTESTVDGRVSVDLTVYSGDFALIREVREVKVPAGTGRLFFRDVPATLVPESIRVRTLGDTGGFSVLEQSFDYDLITPERLLDRYVGKTIKIEVWNRFNDRKRVVDALLLSNSGGPVYKIGNRIYLGYPGIKILPDIPGGLVERPAVVWLYRNTGESLYSLEVSYLSGNIGWSADYVMVLNREDDLGELSGWVTIDNRSGVSFRKAHLKLAAGDVLRKGPVIGADVYMEKRALSAEAPGFAGSPLFEYYVYDLKRRTSIKDKEKKQISLFTKKGIDIEKEFVVRGMTRFFTSPYRRENHKVPVYVYIRFKNPGAGGTATPLPAGTLRLYKEDPDGALEFLGQDRVAHTPVGGEIRLRAGAAGQLTAERVQTEFRRVSSVVYETDWEITIRNNKDGDVTVGIVEPLSGSWDITSSSHAYKKIDAFTIRFDVKVPAAGEVKVSYRARVEL
ncbi:MAG: DUF4139 domain-containing protein [Thermodesulfobacteriota bacterium]|nr:MAG: DUF4139 domain-containing protein [Thermodesulfobacteriota bacterium]